MKYLIENQYWEIDKEYNKEKLLYLLIDRSTEITTFNDFIWRNNRNLWHRDYDLPAYIWNTGEVWWYKDNKRNRINNKPAIVRCNGVKEYWLDQKYIKTEYSK